MRTIYQCLGALAKADARLARFRINFVPGNWIVLGFLAYGVYYFVAGAVDAVTNAPTPAAISLAQVDAAGAGTQRYVSVSGEIFPKVIYRHEDGSTTEWWSVLADRESGSAILVKRSGNIGTAPAHGLSVTGMLRTLNSAARQRLTDDGAGMEGVRVNLQYELVADERPGNPQAAVALAGVSSLVLLAWLTVMLRRDEVFRAGGNFAAPLAVVVRPPVPVRVTGQYHFGKTARRFTDMPAILTLENGRALAQSRIDTSGRFMGVSTGHRVGIWSIPIQPGTVARGRFGFSYFGWSRRYAYQFSYADAIDGALRRATIAADEPQTLMMAVALAAGSMPASFASVG